MTSFFLSFLILAGIWGVFIEPNHIKVEKLSLEIKDLPPSFENLKILHLSDFHSRGFGQKEKKILEILSQLSPDFIFITGDIVDWSTRDFESCRKFWKELSKNYQGRIFAVYGNHDHRNKNFRDLDAFLKESKIEILNNESRKIEKGEDFIYLIGVDDSHLGYDNIENAMKGIKSNASKILLAHSPEIFRKIKDLPANRLEPQGDWQAGKDINLVLAGHTHGGQINIPFFSYFVLPLKYDKKYKSGLFEENLIYLYVSRGIGETVLPIRVNAFPEVALIELR